jgi:hypothetical protein
LEAQRKRYKKEKMPPFMGTTVHLFILTDLKKKCKLRARYQWLIPVILATQG